MDDGIYNIGRRSIFKRKKVLGHLLLDVRDGTARLTHYMKTQLIDNGYVTVEKRQEGRGRPKDVLVLTSSGNRLANLAVNWVRPRVKKETSRRAA